MIIRLENICRPWCFRPLRVDCCSGVCLAKNLSKRDEQQPVYINQTMEIDLPTRWSSWWEECISFIHWHDWDSSLLWKLYLYIMYNNNFSIIMYSEYTAQSIWLLYVRISRALIRTSMFIHMFALIDALLKILDDVVDPSCCTSRCDDHPPREHHSAMMFTTPKGWLLFRWFLKHESKQAWWTTIKRCNLVSNRCAS